MGKIIHVTAPSTLPFPQLASLFPNVSAAISLMAHEETLLQSALSLASMHIEYLQGSPTLSPTTLEERGKAIALLNKNLSNPSDGLIIAVAILGSCEVSERPSYLCILNCRQDANANSCRWLRGTLTRGRHTCSAYGICSKCEEAWDLKT